MVASGANTAEEGGTIAVVDDGTDKAEEGGAISLVESGANEVLEDSSKTPMEEYSLAMKEGGA